MTTEQMQKRLSQFRTQEHERCVVCAPSHPLGLRIEYHIGTQGIVHAEFACPDVFQGYPGQLHGGVITSLLDGAMTNCLFAHGIEAVTAELTVRFLRPVLTDHIAVVTAHLSRSCRRLHVLEAELLQEHMAVARAQGKFIGRPTHAWNAAP